MKHSIAWQLVVVFSAMLLLVVNDVRAEPPQYGPYPTEHVNYHVEVLDTSFQEAVVIYPVENEKNETFPLISYAHGAFGGGYQTYPGYKALFDGLASHGFIVVATKSCSIGCDEGGWETYYLEQLKIIEWAQTMTSDPILGRINHNLGYAIAGHSMGGQATARSAGVASEYNIKAAVIHHPAPTELDAGKNIFIPLGAFTGTLDNCCGSDTTHRIYDYAATPKSFANMEKATHMEPNLFQTRWTAYTAAWFKIFMLGDTSEYYELIYGNSTDSLCGGFYPMEECEALS